LRSTGDRFAWCPVERQNNNRDEPILSRKRCTAAAGKRRAGYVPHGIIRNVDAEEWADVGCTWSLNLVIPVPIPI
jgi:hypothetical protein